MWLAYKEAKEASSSCGRNCDLYFQCIASYRAVYNCPGSIKDKRTTAKYISSIDAKEFATALGDPIPYAHSSTTTTTAPITKPSSAFVSSSKSTNAGGKQRSSRHYVSANVAAAAAAAKEQKKREAERTAAAENGRLGQDCDALYLNNSEFGCTYQPQMRRC